MPPTGFHKGWIPMCSRRACLQVRRLGSPRCVRGGGGDSEMDTEHGYRLVGRHCVRGMGFLFFCFLDHTHSKVITGMEDGGRCTEF